jgi:hypothetical protein
MTLLVHPIGSIGSSGAHALNMIPMMEGFDLGLAHRLILAILGHDDFNLVHLCMDAGCGKRCHEEKAQRLHHVS